MGIIDSDVEGLKQSISFNILKIYSHLNLLEPIPSGGMTCLALSMGERLGPTLAYCARLY